jgi:hypothetical protein
MFSTYLTKIEFLFKPEYQYNTTDLPQFTDKLYEYASPRAGFTDKLYEYASP